MAQELANSLDSSPSPSRRWSLSLRLTLWYLLSSFVILLAASITMYLLLVRNLTREHDQFLVDKIRVLSQELRDRPGRISDLQEEVEETWAPRQYMQVLARVISADGRVVVESPHMGKRLPADAFPDPARVNAKSGPGIDVRGHEDQTFRVLAVRGPGGKGLIQVALDTLPEKQIISAYRRLLLLVLSVALAAGTATGYQLVRTGLGSVSRMAATAQRIGPTNLNERLDTQGLPAELYVMAEKFNAMLDRLHETFASLSRFSADIAHELRTPVNNLRIEFEVALSQARAPDEYRDTLGSGLEECGRLSQIIDSLLFIARAENPRTKARSDSLNVGDELRRIAEFYEATSSDVGVALVVDCPDATSVALDRILFQRAVGNLLSNALAHTPAGGTVTVEAARSNGELSVDVRDTGEGIAPEDLPHVFDRFYRADRARTTGGGNVGLGLAIVKSIMALHGGSVSLTSTLGRGTEVNLRFPISPVEQVTSAMPRHASYDI